jgi:hypothetical protein
MASTLALLFQANVIAQSEDRAETIKESASQKKESSEKDKLFDPSAEDQARFAEFLKQPDTGLIRLLPMDLYRKNPPTHGGRPSYSFSSSPAALPDLAIQLKRFVDKRSSDLNHSIVGGSSPFSDYPSESRTNAPSEYPTNESRYRFENNTQQVETARPYFRSASNFGFIVRLGKVPLEKVTIDHKGVKFLGDIAAPSTTAEARATFARIPNAIGVRKDGYLYNNEETPVSVNHTYALRSIRPGGSDVLVAFRVVRKEKDGSYTILWKRLREFPTPPPLK